MAEDLSLIAITALLPLTAWMLVSQTNPYYALVMRGILGAVAALVYALFGAADVALTEALVGTMLSITLYAVAVRSSLNLRIGVLEHDPETISTEASQPSAPMDLPPDFPTDLVSKLRTAIDPYHLRVELVPYPTTESLHTALDRQDIHATWTPLAEGEAQDKAKAEPTYHLRIRVQRIYKILQNALPETLTQLTYVNASSD